MLTIGSRRSLIIWAAPLIVAVSEVPGAIAQMPIDGSSPCMEHLLREVDALKEEVRYLRVRDASRQVSEHPVIKRLPPVAEVERSEPAGPDTWGLTTRSSSLAPSHQTPSMNIQELGTADGNAITSTAARIPNLTAEATPASFLQPVPEPDEVDLDTVIDDALRPTGEFSHGSRPFDVGMDLYSPPAFEGGLIIYGHNVAMKIGGYVKADFIHDFNAIDATDAFDTTTIPVGTPPRTNSRFHGRQSRLSFDTRWTSNQRTIRILVEGDFFSEGDRYRLRHAYGEVGPLLVGRTWTTFTDVAAAPATLDFEGSVSAVNRRQAQARWTQSILCDDLTLALAIEETRCIIETPVNLSVDPRSPSPDFAGHVRLKREWGQFQLGGLYRIVGVQPTGASVPQFGDEVQTGHAWGLNFTGAILATRSTKAYYQILFGEGIGSYRGLPDAAPTKDDEIGGLPLFGWMVGITHEWTDGLSSNFTYAENSLENTTSQDPDSVHRTTYLAANVMWKPLDRVRVGIEYLHGLRENVDRAVGVANRVQAAFIFDLP